MTKTSLRSFGIGLSSLACALGAVLFASPAKADLGQKTEWTIILLDGSGSMLEPSSIYNGVTVTKWDEAIKRAKAQVIEQRDGKFLLPSDPNWDPELATQVSPNGTTSVLPTRNCYAIYKIGDTSWPRIWPTDPNVSFKCADQTNATTRLAVYNEVDSFLSTLTPPANGGICTPLAGGMCRMLEALRTAGGSNPADLRTLILESDGLENTTPTSEACYGPSSNAAFDRTKTNPSDSQYLAWAGGTDPYSWEWNVYTVAVWNGWENGGLVNTPGYLASWSLEETLAGTIQPDRLGLKVNETFNQFFMNAYGFPTEEDARSQSRLITMHIDALYAYIYPGQTAASNYALGDPTDPLKAFLRSMSQGSKGRFQKLQYNGNPASRPGKNHPFPGDVNDDNKVNMEDYNWIKPADRWNRPSSSSEVAQRADANRDGWVNSADLTLILKNNGCGYPKGKCSNPTICPYVPCKVATLD